MRAGESVFGQAARVSEQRQQPDSRREPEARERALARRVRAGDPEASGLLVHEYGRVLSGFLRQLLGDDHAAEDVLQTVLVEAWRRGPTYDPARGSLLSWLMTIARSRAIDSMRRRVPEPYDPSSTGELLDRVAVSEDHAEEVASRWQLSYLLSALPPNRAELLRMRFQLGLSQTEIAERTGLPLGTVKTRMVAALETLRETMDGD